MFSARTAALSAGSTLTPRGPVARHNRTGQGEDQRGHVYRISYQPDCLRQVKVQRALPSGRRSTMTLFRNPATCREQPPGQHVRTRITCLEQGIDVEVSVRCSGESVQRVTLLCQVPATQGGPTSEEVAFVVENGLPPAP
ncbi:MAG: hypothetical protein EA352_03175 [Gemmatimonadales bacterium]|nr:MAG: hypothetical protein EA352_03175 [Gemmatimonadales bacterium]